MNNLSVFNFNSNDVRVISVDHLNPLFVASDVAKALGYKKPENAIARHCKRKSTTPKQGGGVLTLIPESDLYRLTFRSKLKAAEEFTDWVVEEVLPSIRKTGKYEMPRETLTPEQQRHIQETVSAIFIRDGIHYSTTYKEIKTEFRVGTYKDIKQEQYPTLCQFLNVEPIFTTKEEPAPSVDYEQLSKLMSFTAERISYISQAEDLISKMSNVMQAMQTELAEQRFKTHDLAFDLKVFANRLAR